VSDDGSRVLVPLAGRLFLIERAAGTTRELAIGRHDVGGGGGGGNAR
jgi:hypothetical protein